MTDSQSKDSIPVRCGACGEEIDHLGAFDDGTHSCEESRRIGAFLATGDPEVLG